MEVFFSILPWAAFLACPVMMFWMMRMGGGCGQPKTDPAAQPGDAGVDASSVDEIRALKARIAALEVETGR